ncbi:MAG: hypothetical protein Ta2F_06750 [Termitinemataceae bacterium]|nr:MAG: hypothetical protein Ta2F_06750 [Termitinemataceae bacterium]
MFNTNVILKDIILAVCGSPASMQTAKFAILLAKQCRCCLNAVYVVDTDSLSMLVGENIFTKQEACDWELELKNQGTRILSFVKELATAKGVKINGIELSGDMAKELIGVAREKDAHLIVLCGQNSEKCKNCSVASARTEVQKDADCSVLFVNENTIDKIYKGKGIGAILD